MTFRRKDIKKGKKKKVKSCEDTFNFCIYSTLKWIVGSHKKKKINKLNKKKSELCGHIYIYINSIMLIKIFWPKIKAQKEKEKEKEKKCVKFLKLQNSCKTVLP